VRLYSTTLLHGLKAVTLYLKKEIVIFSGHADHVGRSGDKIYPGADDNASGCAAILEIAQAFQSLEKKPLRSLLFLWVSGEEIGLFGSQSYISNPLFPLGNTVADLQYRHDRKGQRE